MSSADVPRVSALSAYIQSNPKSSSDSTYYGNLALQVQHNLQYQHDWTSLNIHIHSPLTQELLQRPLISGLPPRRIYVHPDDQIEELKAGLQDVDLEIEEEWVLPTHLQEKWSLKKFAKVFDSVGEAPPATEAEHEDGSSSDIVAEEAKNHKKRRGGKRILLATIGPDSTVVYYVVHDGIVKPRQN